MHHKFAIDDFLEEDYDLIALHSSEEDYRLAYLLNKNLNISLFRKKYDLDFTIQQAVYHFSLFEYEDKKKHILYHLIANKTEGLKEEQEPINKASLFHARPERRFLVSELKCDYLLKLTSENGRIPKREIINQINGIKQVISAYSVEVENLKSRNNLIFD